MKAARSSAPVPGIDLASRVAIIHSSFYMEEVARLIEGAKAELQKAGITNISVHPVSGSFEIPLIGAVLAQEKKADALIGLGIIVEGETHHARLVAEETVRGMMDVQTRYGVPFAFEVLYVDKLTDAVARTTDQDNKGTEAARAALHSLAEIRKLRS